MKKWYYINRSKKQIITSTPYDVNRTLYKITKDKNWSTSDEVDLLREDDIDIRELIQDFWYVLDPPIRS